MRRYLPLLALVLLVGPDAHAQATIRVLARSTRSATLAAVHDGRAVRAEQRTVGIVLTTPEGREIRGQVTMIREPRSALYWWTFQLALPNPDSDATLPFTHAIYFTGDKAVGFSFFTPALAVREIRGRQGDFPAIQEAAFDGLLQNVRAIEDGSLRLGQEINLVTSVGREFFYPAGSATVFPMPRIASVARARGEWELRLEGPNRDHLLLTLDDRYAVVRAQRIPEPRRR